jgi:glutamate dehydrogenase
VRLDFLTGTCGADVAAYIDSWLERQAPRIAQFRALIKRAKQAASPNVAMLAELAGQARGLLAR